MSTNKRVSRKTGNYSRRTTTIGSKGTTQSYSSKPPGSRTRRTVSYRNGTMRTTYSTKLGGGWTKTTSKTKTLTRKPRKSSSRPRRSRGGNSDFALTFWKWFFIVFFLYWLFN